jgi:hypothetical protein
MHQDLIEIRPLTDSDRLEVTRFLEAEWGGPITVAHASVFRPLEIITTNWTSCAPSDQPVSDIASVSDCVLS